jgi:GT2 family glycosyltransferase
MPSKKIFAIIVTYNGERWIKKCISSLLASETQTAIIVIDNASEDDTLNIVKEFASVECIQSEKNLGFGKANNLGIKRALEKNCDYIFLLNQDAWIEQNTITALLNVAENNPGYGVISPVHLNGNYTGLDFNFSKQLSPIYCPSFYSDMYVGTLKSLYEIEFVNAAAWLISSSCVKKVGLFEPIFFLYGEDNNYLQRVKFHGFKIGVTPACTICHDRAVRKGEMSENGIKIWERTSSLITILDISNSYTYCICLFLKEKIVSAFKFILQKRVAFLKYSFSELFFFSTNFLRLKKIRNEHKYSFEKSNNSGS